MDFKLAKFMKRITREISDAQQSDKFSFYYNEEIYTGYMKFKVERGTYKGQTHIVELLFVYGNNTMYYYPFDPPRLTFKTPIFHPNIGPFKEGIVCLDTINQTGLWDATCKLEGIFNIIQTLLEDPNPDSPKNPEAGSAFISLAEIDRKKMWKKQCRNYYNKHIEKCQKIFDMFPSEEDPD